MSRHARAATPTYRHGCCGGPSGGWSLGGSPAIFMELQGFLGKALLASPQRNLRVIPPRHSCLPEKGGGKGALRAGFLDDDSPTYTEVSNLV